MDSGHPFSGKDVDIFATLFLIPELKGKPLD
jgi:hypothetical protein